MQNKKNIGWEVVTLDCFAYSNNNGKFKCSALTVTVCEGKACPFYKTEKECVHAEVETLKKLRELPLGKRLEIKKKYGVNGL